MQQVDADMISYRYSKVAGGFAEICRQSHDKVTWKIFNSCSVLLEIFPDHVAMKILRDYNWIATGNFSVCVPLCQSYPNLLRFDDLTVCTPPFALRDRHFHVSRTSVEKSGSISYVASIFPCISDEGLWDFFRLLQPWQPVGTSSSHGNRWNLFEKRAVSGGYNHQDSHGTAGRCLGIPGIPGGPRTTCKKASTSCMKNTCCKYSIITTYI